MGLEVARAITLKAIPTSQLDPIPLPFMDCNMRAVAKMIGGFSHLEYIVEPITKDEKQDSLMMMMIAFITIKSCLVPLIEGLCAQIYFRFEISVVCSHLLLFFFVKEKTC